LQLYPSVLSEVAFASGSAGIPGQNIEEDKVEVLERLVHDGKISVYEVVEQTSLDRLNDVVTMLLRHHSSTEVCTALRDRIARSPLAQFNRLKTIYFQACVKEAAQTK